MNSSNDQNLGDYFENSPIGLHAFGPDRKIIYMNQTELDMLGYSRDEIISRKEWADLIIEEQRAQFEQHWKDINEKGKVNNLHYTLIHKKGYHIDVILNASAHFDNEGKLLNTRGVMFFVSKNEIVKDKSMLSTAELELIDQKKVLEQKNLVLNQLLIELEIEKNKIKDHIKNNLNQLVWPLLEKLKRKGSPIDKRHIEMLERNLETITAGFGTKVSGRDLDLSPKEIEICNMIKQGHTSKEIADLLNSSIRTIDNHRNHIRKKLKISKENTDLAAFLKSMEMV